MTVIIRPVQPGDAQNWAVLYAGYREFYGRGDEPGAVERTWGWIIRGEHSLLGLVAVMDDELVGLANLRWFARPLAAATGLYLDDLFTSPAARGHGVGRALLVRAAEIARDGGGNVVRWTTAADNATARRLYDDVATATAWVTYDMEPAAY